MRSQIKRAFNFAIQDMKLSKKVFYLVLVPAVCSIVFLAVLMILLLQAEQESAREQHGRAVMYQTLYVQHSLTDSFMSLVRYSFAKDENLLTSYSDSKKETYKNVDHLLRSAHYNSKEFAACKKLEELVLKMFEQGDRLWNLVHLGGKRIAALEALELRSSMQKSIREIAAACVEIRAATGVDVEEHVEVTNWWRNIAKIFLGCGLISVFALSMVIARLMSTSVTERIGKIITTTNRVAAGEELPALLPGADEMARLDRFIHHMVTRLKDAHAREQAVIEHAADAICSLDPSGRILAVNPATAQLFDHDVSQLLGMTIADLLGEGAARLLLQTREESGATEIEICARRGSGEEMVLLWSVSKGADERLFCVVHDITDRKQVETLLRQSEERLRLIIENMPLAVFALDGEERITYMNEPAAKLADGTVKELVGTSVQQVVEPFKACEGTSRANLKNSGGKDIPIEATIVELSHYDRSKLLLFCLDISEREKLDAMKRDFVAMVSHDLRSPLTSLQMILHMLHDGVYGSINEQGQIAVSRSDDELGRLIRLVNTLLDYERMDRGELTLNIEPVSAASLFTSAIDAVRALYRSKGLELSYLLPEQTIMADGDKIIQVLINLLTNAIKFSPAGSTITLAAEERLEWLHISISDEGIGVPAEQHETIFEKYRQVRASDACEKGGTGLGLAICRQIIQMHNGTIGVNSQEGKGSTFWFTLPIVKQSITVEVCSQPHEY